MKTLDTFSRPRQPHRWALALALLLSACGVQSKEPPFCASVRPVLQPAKVLNAISEGHIQRLVDCGLKPDQGIPIKGEAITPLQLAVSIGRPELVEQVVRAGADPNAGGVTSVDTPPLEVALSFKKYQAAKKLLALGARADYTLKDNGMNALMAMVFDDSDAPVEMIHLLVKNGAAINGQDATGGTPLHWSARRGHTAYAQALLELGANPCIKNHKGQTPADRVPKQYEALREKLTTACKRLS